MNRTKKRNGEFWNLMPHTNNQSKDEKGWKQHYTAPFSPPSGFNRLYGHPPPSPNVPSLPSPLLLQREKGEVRKHVSRKLEAQSKWVVVTQ
mmetsp:Transcript_26130/g.53513  ORF Transcript_26130/g.53513 Transcript_26130/m.53513 type:complete len:91 (-) Transcript_26130:144-416(-)